MIRATVTDETHKQRLDVFAQSLLPTVSRAYVVRLCEEQRILVNNEPTKPGYRVREGDVVTSDFEASELEQIEDIDLPILYQDKDVLVINKPVGVISHSRGKYWNEPSVASFIRQVTHQSGERAGIVHRLDRATSGVMICAKNQQTLSWLQRQFSERLVQKTYIAVVTSSLKLPEAVIDMPIERNPKMPQTFRVGANGKPAITTYKTIKSGKKYSLLELTPKTGRTHQLRVHLKEQRHPIVGDTLYDGEKAERLYLHAFALEISFADGTHRRFEAPIPAEFNKLVEE